MWGGDDHSPRQKPKGKKNGISNGKDWGLRRLTLKGGVDQTFLQSPWDDEGRKGRGRYSRGLLIGVKKGGNCRFGELREGASSGRLHEHGRRPGEFKVSGPFKEGEGGGEPAIKWGWFRRPEFPLGSWGGKA